MRIPKSNLSLTDNEDPRVWSLCALSADELLLAMGAKGLRALSLHTGQLAAHEPIALRDEVIRVAFDSNTDTLLLFVKARKTNNYQIMSLRRNASEWLEVQRLNTKLFNHFTTIYMYIAMCDSRVMLLVGNKQLYTLYEFDVSAEHILRNAGSVTLETATYDLACTRRDNDTLVAFSHDTSVSLQRLTSLPLRLEPLASVNLTDPWRLLFRGDLLLVNVWNHAANKYAIVSFRATGNALTEPRVLLDAQRSDRYVGAWAFAGDRLVVSELNRTDETQRDLLVYDFKK